MGTNHKVALIPQWLRKMIRGWQRAASRRRYAVDNSTIQRDDIELQAMSLEEDEQQSMDIPELQRPNVTLPSLVTGEISPNMSSNVPVNVARATVDEIEEEPSPDTDETSAMAVATSSTMPPVENVARATVDEIEEEDPAKAQESISRTLYFTNCVFQLIQFLTNKLPFYTGNDRQLFLTNLVVCWTNQREPPHRELTNHRKPELHIISHLILDTRAGR